MTRRHRILRGGIFEERMYDDDGKLIEVRTFDLLRKGRPALRTVKRFWRGTKP